MKRRFYIVTHKKRTLPRAYDTFLKHIMAEAESLQNLMLVTEGI
jgi:hypothetical protein